MTNASSFSLLDMPSSPLVQWLDYRPQDELPSLPDAPSTETIEQILETPVAKRLIAAKIAAAQKLAKQARKSPFVAALSDGGWGNLYPEDFRALPRMTPGELAADLENVSLKFAKPELAAATIRAERLAISPNMLHSEICIICRENLLAICLACECGKDPLNYAPRQCTVVTGRCHHSYHGHCLLTWHATQGKPMCPLCKATWSSEFDRAI